MKAINGKIEHASLVVDYGLRLKLSLKMANNTMVCYSAWLGLEKGAVSDEKIVSNYAADAILNIFDVVDVKSFEYLQGKPVRVIFTGDGRLGSTCIGIQNFLDFTKFYVGERELSKQDLAEILEDQEDLYYLRQKHGEEEK